MGAGWNNEQIGQLRKFWPTSMPASEIAALIGKSKNSVVSKAHRLGLPGREGPQNITRARQKKREAAAAKEWRADGCKFIEAKDWRERMNRGEQIYCGAPVGAPGSSWCDCHRAIVFVKAAPAEDLGDPLPGRRVA